MKAGIRKTIEGLKSYMVKKGYTGLYSTCDFDGCGCEISDIAPCGCDFSDCNLGYKRECTPEESKEYDFMVTNIKPTN